MSELIPAFQRRVFVVMPFGTKAVPRKPKADAGVGTNDSAADEALKVNFNDVYQRLFKPALQAAGLQPFRADDEASAGNILKDMFAELVTADLVLADISILNANVFYELGVRHGIGPRGVFCVHAGWADRPFDIAPERTFKYNGQLFRVDQAHDEAWEKAVANEVVQLTGVLMRAVAADPTTEGSPVYSNLPNLRPVDASRIDTARFKHYQALADEWQQLVQIARQEGRPEDVLTLAGDVPSPYFRRQLLQQCGEALLGLGRFPQAESIYEDLLEDLTSANSPQAFKVRCQLALLANRCGRMQEAKVKLESLGEEAQQDPEACGLLGRVYKDFWRSRWATEPLKPLEERLKLAAVNASVAKNSLTGYERAFRSRLDSYYNGINALTLSALLDHVALRTKRPVRPAFEDFDDLAGAVRVAAKARLESRDEAIWAKATLGELHLLRGEAVEALDYYEQVTADTEITWFQLHSMLEQVQLLELLDFQTEAVAPVAALLKERCLEREQARPSYRRIAICSGHMTDKPGRPEPRFPASKESAVRQAIAERLESWGLGAGDLAVCGGARGADLIFGEECLKRGLKVRLLLSKELDPFVESSVRVDGTDYVQRFHTLRRASEVATQPERLGRLPEPGHSGNASQFLSVYARTNLWIINTARIEARSSDAIHALMVWDEKPTGDGPGGTSDFEARVRQLGGQREIINPTKL